MRRLKWLQPLAKRPNEHAQVIAALIGRVQCERENVDVHGGQVTAKTNPWLKQLWDDVNALEFCDEGA
eukprot:7521380-Pyramimonas_sp.AAC.1